MNSMSKYKSEFIVKFGDLMQKNLTVWKAFQKMYRKKLYTTDLLYYFLVFAAGFIPGKRETDYFNNLWFHFWFGVVLFVGSIITMIAVENKDYQTQVKKTFFNDLLKVFSEKIYHKIWGDYTTFEEIDDYKCPSAYITDAQIEDTELFNHEITSRENDDMFFGEYNDVNFAILETDFGWNSNDKYRTYHSMFKGVLFKFDMNKEINSRVLVYSKSMINICPKGYEKVNLEYDKFSKKYNVYVKEEIMHEGQIEARYLFNTAFLDRFMQLHTSFGIKRLRCSIYKNKLLIFLDTNRDLFEMNHLLGKVDDVKQYESLFNEFASVFSFIDVLNLSSRTKL